jgi:hypothetical protein
MKEALYKGNSHDNGGIKVLVDESKHIEVEGHEYLLCNKAMQTTKIFEFENKTNKEILDEFHTYSTCEFKQNEAHSGDFIICKKVVLDTNKRNITGTIKEIVNIMQSEKGCRQSTDDVYKTGGEVENDTIFEVITYFVSAETDNDSSNIYNGIDYKRAKLEFDSVNIRDFGGENGGFVLFQKRTDKYKFSGDLEDGYYQISDYPIEDYYKDKDYFTIIDEGELENIDSKDVASVNDESDKLLDDVQIYYQKTYGKFKYNKITVDNGKDEYDDDYKEYGCIQLRITNHSENVNNNDKFGNCDYYISVVIANKNLTKDKFLTSIYERRRNEIELTFNTDNSFDEIINEIDSEIANGKLYIAEKLDISINDVFKKGGEVKENDYNELEKMEINIFDETKYNDNGKVCYRKTYTINDSSISIDYCLDNFFKIDAIGTKEKSRRGGDASKLIAYVKEIAVKNNFQKIDVNLPIDENTPRKEYSLEDYKKAVSFYKKNGFKFYKNSTVKMFCEVKADKLKTGGEIKPVKQLGTGANVYFESDKYRVNDFRGKYLLNSDGISELFDNVNEAVFVAKKLQENAPQGLNPVYHNIYNIIKNYKKDYIESQNALNKGIKIESEHIDTAKKLYEHKITPKQAAESIAKEHLAESPQYYNELEKMETKLQNNNLTDIKVSIKVEDYKNEFEINKAIEKLINYKGDDRDSYNADEINFISFYSGYGGLGKFGTVGMENIKGLKYEFYTPDEIVKKMWGLAYKYGYGTLGDNSVMETSAGIGNFIKYAPKDVKVVCNEINKYSAKILQILYPHAVVYNKYFEQNFITKDNKSMKNKIDDLDKYSLIIGNPPYGKFTGKYVGMGEDTFTKASNFCEYFITRSLDLLMQDGLLIYIVGAEQFTGGTLFLDSKLSKVKEIIFDKAQLIDAYRLPVKIFERTGVSTEILIFRKK